MSDYSYSADQVVRTLYEVVRHQQGSESFVEILSNATPSIEEEGYDNLDGGTTYYGLYLYLPPRIFAKVEPVQEGIQQALSAKLRSCFPSRNGEALGNAHLAPAIDTGDAPILPVVTEDTVERIWHDGFRLFLSHTSANKIAIGLLKERLRLYGISCFVAHQDIEPTLEWRSEIISALGSAQALCAILTDDYHASYWTDQEIGFALGRGIPVLAVSCPAPPYGFIASYQAPKGKLTDPRTTARTIAECLIKIPTASHILRPSLVSALSASRSFEASKMAAAMLSNYSGFTEQERVTIRSSLSNSQVAEAFGVPEAIERLLKT